MLIGMITILLQVHFKDFSRFHGGEQFEGNEYKELYVAASTGNIASVFKIFIHVNINFLYFYTRGH